MEPLREPPHSPLAAPSPRPLAPPPLPFAAAAQPLRPIAEHERILALDALRGVALLGILMVNIQFFAFPFTMAVYDPALAEAPASHQAARLLVRVLFEYKFISLFSLMFGMGLVVQMNRAAAAGRPFVFTYLRRLAVLAAIGFLHVLLLWAGDILLFYAVGGLLLLAVARLRPLTLVILAAAFVLLGALLLTGWWGLQMLAWELGAMDPAALAPPPLRGLEAIFESKFDAYSPVWIDAEIAAYKEGLFLDALAFRMVTYFFAALSAALGFGWHIVGLFLLGAALMKLRFFDPQHVRWHLWAAAGGLLVGLPLKALGGYVEHASGYDYSWALVAMEPLRAVGAVALMLGYVGAITLLVQGGWLRPLWQAIGAVGRMALTNYLLQTVIATFIMYWWGLALFNEFTRPQLIALALAIYLGQVLLSALWLQAFSMGPAEWAWRSLTYLSLQPIVRKAAAPRAG